MEWSYELIVSFINLYEKHPLLWDASHRCYKVVSKKCEAWEAISQELEVEVPELKRKMTSLLATYRKVRHKLAKAGDEDDTSPAWFAYKHFGFLHNVYQPRVTVITEEGLGSIMADTQNEEYSNEVDLILNNEMDNLSSEKRKHDSLQSIPIKRARIEDDSRVEETFNTLQSVAKKDEFDSFGEYIANFLRSMDKITRAYVKKEFAEIIFKAETGSYTPSHLLIQPSHSFYVAPRPNSNNSSEAQSYNDLNFIKRESNL